MGDFASRLQLEFEDQDAHASEHDESQDWFVNDSPKKESFGSNHDEGAQTVDDMSDARIGTVPSRIVRSVSTPVEVSAMKPSAEEESTDCDLGTDPMAFLHHTPSTFSVFVMELTTGSEVPRYGTKSFRLYLPQVHASQTDFCLYARKRLHKHKYRFSLDENFTTPWVDSMYEGKMVLTPSSDTKRFRLLAKKAAGRTQFEIKQETRKLALCVRLNATTNRVPFFRKRATSVDEQQELYRSNIQKYINPMADVRCARTNYTVFKMEKEGDSGGQKYIVSYMRPFSLYLSCCLAVGLEAHLLE